jgi:hypothetical protein
MIFSVVWLEFLHDFFQRRVSSPEGQSRGTSVESRALVFVDFCGQKSIVSREEGRKDAKKEAVWKFKGSRLRSKSNAPLASGVTRLDSRHWPLTAPAPLISDL